MPENSLGKTMERVEPIAAFPNFSYKMEGPKFTELLHDSIQRDMSISSTAEPKGKGKIEQTFSERDGLVGLESVLNAAIGYSSDELLTKLGEKIHVQNYNLAMALRERLVYVGYHELEQATQGIASHFLEKVMRGETLYIPSFPGERSERYITLLVLEAFNKLTNDNPELRSFVHFVEDRDALAKKCVKDIEKGRKPQVVLLDDFVNRGDRIKEQARSMAVALKNQNMNAKQIGELIEANLVAAPIPTEESKYRRYQILMSGGLEIPLSTFSYYGLTEDKVEANVWNGGVLVTGSHCSTDWGFEDRIKKIIAYLKRNSVYPSDSPAIPVNLVRPYEPNHEGNFSDKYLRERWDIINSQYKLNDSY